jgi:lysyl-tRNA synthetase class I
MDIFKEKLIAEIKKSRCNYFSDNYDEQRYGKLPNNNYWVNFIAFPIKSIFCKLNTSNAQSKKYAIQKIDKLGSYIKNCLRSIISSKTINLEICW